MIKKMYYSILTILVLAFNSIAFADVVGPILDENGKIVSNIDAKSHSMRRIAPKFMMINRELSFIYEVVLISYVFCVVIHLIRIRKSTKDEKINYLKKEIIKFFILVVVAYILLYIISYVIGMNMGIY